MTWLWASRLMRCDEKSGINWLHAVSHHHASHLGPLLKLFDSYTLVHRVGFLPFINRCYRQNYAMCVVRHCSCTFQVGLGVDFVQNCINRCFPLGKVTIRASSTRIKLHLEGFKLALWGNPVAHQIIAGNSISVTYGCHGHASVMACFHYWFQCPCLVRFMEFIVFHKEN